MADSRLGALPDFFGPGGFGADPPPAPNSSGTGSNDPFLADFDIPLTGLPGLDGSIAPTDDLAAITGESTDDGSWETQAALAAQVQAWQRDRARAANRAVAVAAETYNDPALRSLMALALDEDDDAPVMQAAAPAPAPPAALSLAEVEAALLAATPATAVPEPLSPTPVAAPPSLAPPPAVQPTHVQSQPPPGMSAPTPPWAGAPPAPFAPHPGMPPPYAGVPPPGMHAPHPGVAQPHPHAAMPPMIRPTLLPPAVYQQANAQLQAIMTVAARTPGGIMSAPPHVRQQAATLQAMLVSHAAAAAGMARPPMPGMPPRSYAQVSAPPPGVMQPPATQPQQPPLPPPTAPRPAPEPQHHSAPRPRALVTLADVLGHRIPPSAHGTFMSPRDVHSVASAMYYPFKTAGETFAECYYLFALHAKRAAMAAAGPKAADAPIVNALDAAAVLTSIGQSSSRAAPRTAPATAPAAGSEPAGPAQPPLPPVDAAVDVVASLPLFTPSQRLETRNMTEQRNDQLARRRLWEQHSGVLGRVTTNTVRGPRQVVTLTASGRTRASDIDRGMMKQSISVSDIKRSAKAAGPDASTGGPDAAPEPAVEGSTDMAALWIARANVDEVSQSLLMLQEATRRLQAHMRMYPPTSKEIMQGLRDIFGRRRAALARMCGLRALPAGYTHDDAGGGGVEGAPTFIPMTPLPRLGPSQSVHDDVITSLCSMSKGKRVLVRAIPMLHACDRMTAITAGMRHLPVFIASPREGAEAEAADALLARALTSWVKEYMPPLDAPPHTPRTVLASVTVWLQELHSSHSGAIVRALLQHPGASDVISAVLQRGEEEEKRVIASVPSAGGDAPAAAPVNPEVDAWNAVTASLAKSYLEEE